MVETFIFLIVYVFLDDEAQEKISAGINPRNAEMEQGSDGDYGGGRDDGGKSGCQSVRIKNQSVTPSHKKYPMGKTPIKSDDRMALSRERLFRTPITGNLLSSSRGL